MDNCLVLINPALQKRELWSQALAQLQLQVLILVLLQGGEENMDFSVLKYPSIALVMEYTSAPVAYT